MSDPKVLIETENQNADYTIEIGGRQVLQELIEPENRLPDTDDSHVDEKKKTEQT
jgi:hypothetical protein